MPNSSWMRNIPDDTELWGVTMPGSHDAGVSAVVNDWKRFPVPSSLYVCQGQNIAGQLNSGSRFFDMRFELKDNEPISVHETVGIGGWGETATSVFTAINAHLQANPTEVIIVRVSHTPRAAGARVYALQQQILNSSNRAWTGIGNIAEKTIQLLRGKAVITYDPKALPANSANGAIEFSKYKPNGSAETAEGVITCGKFPNTTDMNKIDYKAVKRTAEHLSHGDTTRHLFMLYWQMTGGNVQANTELTGPGLWDQLNSNSGTRNNVPYLLSMLAGWKSGQTASYRNRLLQLKRIDYPENDLRQYPNIINLDFINDDVCETVITFNQWARDLW